MSDFAILRYRRASTGIWPILAFAAAALAVGAALPNIIISTLVLTLLMQAAANAILATSVGFLFRQNGLTSFGQAAWFGLSAYIIAVNSRFGFVGAEAGVVLAVLLPPLIAFVFGLIIVRLPHLAYSMLTLAIAQAFYEFFAKWREIANGEDGLEIKFPKTIFGVDAIMFQQPRTMVVIVWSMLVLVLLLYALMARSHFGLLTRAIRENEERARFVGYETLLPRALINALAALIASIAGVLFAFYNGFVTPSILHWSLSGEALIMAFIGGPRAICGPALGAAIFFVLKDLAGDYTEHWPAIIGATLMIVTVLIPNGIAGSLSVALSRVGIGGAR
jgi:branched-chain amino acid transport system permease protein